MKNRPSKKQKQGKRPEWILRLYVVGNAPRSVVALGNLENICRTHLRENYQLEVIDVIKEPRRCLTDQILATPTLIKASPPPMRRIIGDLSEESKVLAALGVAPREEGTGS